MIEVDVFWSFAMGGSFAAAASPFLLEPRFQSEPFVNRYFVYTLLYLSLLFAPSGAYLLWQHTGWETMWVFSDRKMHGILPLLFAFTNVAQGILGFYLVRKCIEKRYYLLATFLWTSAYAIMFGILGFGYKRFLYPGDAAQWNYGTEFRLVDFFKSEIFFTLLIMGIFILPPLYYPLVSWPLEAINTKTGDQRGLAYIRLAYYNCLKSFLACIAVGIVGYESYLLASSDKERYRLTDRRELSLFGMHAALVGFLVAQLVFGLLVVLPLLYIEKRLTKDAAPKSNPSAPAVLAVKKTK